MIVNSCYFVVGGSSSMYVCVFFPSFCFVCMRLFISCGFVGVISHLELEFIL